AHVSVVHEVRNGRLGREIRVSRHFLRRIDHRRFHHGRFFSLLWFESPQSSDFTLSFVADCVKSIENRMSDRGKSGCACSNDAHSLIG
ncbi:hypothetical protein PFISCL1PPCAC_27155, partial [Pristionchus fissidentatus]